MGLESLVGWGRHRFFSEMKLFDLNHLGDLCKGSCQEAVRHPGGDGDGCCHRRSERRGGSR